MKQNMKSLQKKQTNPETTMKKQIKGFGKK